MTSIIPTNSSGKIVNILITINRVCTKPAWNKHNFESLWTKQHKCMTKLYGYDRMMTVNKRIYWEHQKQVNLGYNTFFIYFIFFICELSNTTNINIPLQNPGPFYSLIFIPFTLTHINPFSLCIHWSLLLWHTLIPVTLTYIDMHTNLSVLGGGGLLTCLCWVVGAVY